MKMTPEWIQRLIQVVKQVAPRDFFGQVEVNVQGGAVSNVNVKQSFKEDTAK